MSPGRVALLLLLAVAASGEENLLPNGSFEKGEEGWVFFQFGQGDPREIDGKTKSLHVAKGSKSPDRPAMLWTDYALDPSQEGKLSFSIRAKGKKLGRTQILFILWDDKEGIAVEEKMHDGDLGAKWQTFERTIEIPGPAKGGRILVRLFEDGELWLDDASVTIVGAPAAAPAPAPKGALAVRNGDFEKSKEGWAVLPGSEDLKVSLDKRELRLSRGGHRLYPEQGVQQVVKLAGRTKAVTLRCRARSEGARAVVALLAETQEGALVAFVRAETAEQQELALPLALPTSVKQLRIVLAIRGPGDAWFDDVRLEGK
jgi:hypothetical protein